MDESSHCNEIAVMSTNTRSAIATPWPLHCQLHSMPHHDVNRPRLLDRQWYQMCSLVTADGFHPVNQIGYHQHRQWPKMLHNPAALATVQTDNLHHRSPLALSRDQSMTAPRQQHHYIHDQQITAAPRHGLKCWQLIWHQAAC